MDEGLIHGVAADRERDLVRFAAGEILGLIGPNGAGKTTTYLQNPRAMVFDEPLTGLDPRGIRTVKQSIREHAAGGMATIVSSHLLPLVEDLCTQLLVLHQGRVRFFGSVDQARGAAGRLASPAVLGGRVLPDHAGRRGFVSTEIEVVDRALWQLLFLRLRGALRRRLHGLRTLRGGLLTLVGVTFVGGRLWLVLSGFLVSHPGPHGRHFWRLLSCPQAGSNYTAACGDPGVRVGDASRRSKQPGRCRMSSEVEKVLNRQKEIRSKSPWIHAALGIVFLLIGILLLVADLAGGGVPGVGAACGVCFGLAAMGFASHQSVVQAKLNLELCEAIRKPTS